MRLLVLLLLLATCTAQQSVDAPDELVARPIVFDATLWQAARETVDFLPLIATDPVSGSIKTDWGSPRDKPTEQYKISVRLDYGAPYATAAHITVLRQVLNGNGWQMVGLDRAVAAGLQYDIALSAEELRQLHWGQIAGN